VGTHEERDEARQWFGMADAVPLMLDARGVVTSWTRSAQALLAYPASEAVGIRLADLLAEPDARRVPDLVEACHQDGGWTGPLTALRKDGHQVRIMARITSVQGGGRSRWLVLLSEPVHTPGRDIDRAVLEQMVSGSPMGFAIVDTELRFVWANAALEQFGGGSAHGRLGKRATDIQPHLGAESIEKQMRQVLATGDPVIGYEHIGRVRSDPYRESAFMMSFFRLEDDAGRPLGVYYTVFDITERHRTRRRLALLDRAGEHIGRSLDIERTAQELADVVVPEFADFVAVDLLEPVLRGDEPATAPVAATDGVRLRRAGLGQSPEDGDGLPPPGGTGGTGGLTAYPAGSPPVRCLATGLSWREARLDPLVHEWARNVLAGRQSTVTQPGSHSAMIVPLRARGTTLGVTTFFRGKHHGRFDEEDLRLAEDLVARAAVCVDNARRYTRERNAALVLQRSLLPHRLPEQDAVEVAACYRPADELTGLGGDWYDLVPLSGARVALVVGEVPGHGITAAAAMGRLRTAVRTLAALDLPPEEVLAHLDDLVARSAHEEGLEMYSAGGDNLMAIGSGCVYVVYDPSDGRCTMAAAGHPAPVVVAPDGAVTLVRLPQGPPLGAGGPPFESVELAVEEGSTLLLHTDGLLAHGIAWSVDADQDRLRRALERSDAPLALRCRNLVDALVPTRPHDDVALLMARTRRLGDGQVAAWDLPADPAVVADARRRAARQLDRWNLDELVFTTELVVSELVTNAIRYSEGPIRLRLIRERTLVCEVFDSGATAPHMRHPRTTDEGGRGLLLVSQVTQRWGTRFVPDGKIIWAEQPLTDPSA
jgi:PAS domain S-box-containing protein